MTSDENGPTVPCRACRGTGRVSRPRLYLSSSGEVSTVAGDGRCRHCRPRPDQPRERGATG